MAYIYAINMVWALADTIDLKSGAVGCFKGCVLIMDVYKSVIYKSMLDEMERRRNGDNKENCAKLD